MSSPVLSEAQKAFLEKKKSQLRQFAENLRPLNAAKLDAICDKCEEVADFCVKNMVNLVGGSFEPKEDKLELYRAVRREIFSVYDEYFRKCKVIWLDK